MSTDILRLIAAYLVVLSHVTAGCETALECVYRVISCTSVPVFILISGYYMLAHESTYASLFRKAGRALLQLFSVSFFYWFCERASGAALPLRELPRYLLTGPVHMWYQYAIAVLYIFTPVFQALYRNLSKRDYLYTLALFFVFGSIVTLMLRSECFPLLDTIVEKSKAATMLAFPFLYLCGGYLRRFGVSKKERSVLCWLGVALTAAAGTVFALSSGEWKALLTRIVLSIFSPNAIFAGIACFLAVQALLQRRPITSEPALRVLRRCAACTPGIYFIHPLWINLLAWNGVVLLPDLFRPLRAPLLALLFFAFSLLIVLPLREVSAVLRKK